MNLRLSIFCILSLTLGTSVYIFQSLELSLPRLLNNYLNDFLIIPIVLYLCLLFLRWSRNDANFVLKLPIILYVCALYAFIFEYLLPKQLVRYTSDPIDALLYFIGGLVFYLLQNKPSKA